MVAAGGEGRVREPAVDYVWERKGVVEGVAVADAGLVLAG